MAQNDSESVRELDWVENLIKKARKNGLIVSELLEAQRHFKNMGLEAKADVFLFLLGTVARQEEDANS